MCLSVHLRLSRISYFFFYSACDHRDLHSFPTRRSSDLRASILIDGARLAGARPYAERSEEQPGWHDRAAEFLLRSEEHTSELQSRQYLVCRLLLEKKKIADASVDAWRHGPIAGAGGKDP